MAEETYKRLPGRGSNTIFAVKLWLAKDHLLLVESMGFSESYKRFYFRDIESITVTHTRRRLIINVVLAVFATLFTLPILLGDLATTIVCSILALPIYALIVVNNIKGPACVCHLTTAVQREKLAPLSRCKRAEKILREIEPLILAAQTSPEPRQSQ
jgi:hypothetical protein